MSVDVGTTAVAEGRAGHGLGIVLHLPDDPSLVQHAFVLHYSVIWVRIVKFVRQL